MEEEKSEVQKKSQYTLSQAKACSKWQKNNKEYVKARNKRYYQKYKDKIKLKNKRDYEKRKAAKLAERKRLEQIQTSQSQTEQCNNPSDTLTS